MEYSIWIKGQEIEVSEEVYRSYWKGIRKERYFLESDIHNKIFSYDALDSEGMNGSDMFGDATALPVEEQVIWHMNKRDLVCAVEQLDDKERDLIRRMYLYDESLRKIAKGEKISPSTLQYRHQKVLLKLKKYLLESRGQDYE